jgi:hypothetical protein
VPGLLAKIAQYRPRIVCFVGLGIADVVRSQVVSVRIPRIALSFSFL